MEKAFYFQVIGLSATLIHSVSNCPLVIDTLTYLNEMVCLRSSSVNPRWQMPTVDKHQLAQGVNCSPVRENPGVKGVISWLLVNTNFVLGTEWLWSGACSWWCLQLTVEEAEVQVVDRNHLKAKELDAVVVCLGNWCQIPSTAVASKECFWKEDEKRMTEQASRGQVHVFLKDSVHLDFRVLTIISLCPKNGFVSLLEVLEMLHFVGKQCAILSFPFCS